MRIPELKKQADRFIGPDGKDFPLVKALSEHVFMPWMHHLGEVDLSKEEEESLDSYNPMGDQENERLVRQVEKMKKYVNEKHSTEEKRIEVESQPGVDTATSIKLDTILMHLSRRCALSNGKANHFHETLKMLLKMRKKQARTLHWLR